MKSYGWLAIALFIAVLAGPAIAQGQVKPLEADPSVAMDDHELRLQALTPETLDAWAKVWQTELEAATSSLNEKKIAASKGEGDAKAAADAEVDEAQSSQKDVLDRYKAVIAELRSKGGDEAVCTAYDAYASAVSGSEFEGLTDVRDVSAAWTFVRDWVTGEDKGIKWGKAILSFLVILISFKILSNVVGKVVGKAVARMKKTSNLLRDFFVNAVRKLIFLIGVIVALDQLGVNVGPFVAAIGAVGFVLGFALQGTLSNFAAGIMILLYRPYDIGDVVTVSGQTGTVGAMTLVSTTIKTADNQIVIVPNGSIWGDVITNITGSDIRRVDMVFGIGYSDDIAKAQGVLEGILEAHEGVLADPEPVVRVHELADSSVNFVVRPWAKTADYWSIRSEVTRAVKERFDAEEISIPFPQQDVHMHTVTG